MQDLTGRVILGIALLLAARGVAIGGEPTGGLRTILGTSTWDVDADKLVRGGAADFFWRHMDATKRSLTPTGGAKAAVLRDAKFADVSAEEAGKLRLTAEPLDASDKGSILLPGTVVVFRTNKGRLGILEIVRYRALHDLSFPEAKQIPAEAREMIRKSPNMPKYHLVVRWRFLGK
jgi:hypothetical protein